MCNCLGTYCLFDLFDYHARGDNDGPVRLPRSRILVRPPDKVDVELEGKSVVLCPVLLS